MKRTVSKKIWVICNILLLFLVLEAVDFFSGMPFPVPEIQFRREERAKLIGPGTILGMEEIDYSWCNRMIVAETEEGAILWVSGQDYDRSDLAYRKKGNGSLLMAPPGSLGFMGSTDEVHLPLVLFDDQPRARQAELHFTLKANFNGEDFEKAYTLTAERTVHGYFLFTLSAGMNDPGWLGAEGIAIQTFANISANLEQNPDYTVPVQVRFYDSRDTLIGEETVIVSGAPGD